MDMCDETYLNKLLKLSISINNKTGIQYDISSNDDINIRFIEAVFSVILPDYGNSTFILLLF